MGRGMLRAHVDDEFVRIEERLVGRVEVENVLDRSLRLTWPLVVLVSRYCPLSIPKLICTTHCPAAGCHNPAQRNALPSVGSRMRFHVGMAVELDAEHVEDFRSSQLAVPSGERNWRWFSPSAIAP